MLFSKIKKLSYQLVIVLALLQVLMPLIHGHPAGSPVSAVTGFHIHEMDADDAIHGMDQSPTVRSQHIHEQVIGVAGGFEPDTVRLLTPFLYCLFFIAFTDFVLTNKQRFASPESRIFLRRSPSQRPNSPRAPPLK